MDIGYRPHYYVDPGVPIEKSDETCFEGFEVFSWRSSNTRIILEEIFFLLNIFYVDPKKV
jgi:hypothetical protein